MQNILLAVTGLTPQILTETLYYYTVVARPPVAFDEIQVITTAPGKDRILKELLHPEHGKFHSFCRDYSASGIRFDESRIHVIGGKEPLDDIRSVEDNGIMAAQILGIVKKLTLDPTTALYCSIAGGRKTMGAYLALALQLYGRPQDRLSHVLVTPEFEALADFYYPPPEDRIIQGRDASGKPIALHTKDAKINLADIPFISVRRLLPKRGNYPIDELVRRLQASVEGTRVQTTLRISLRQKKVWVGSVAVLLPPKELALYAFFADAKHKCRKKRCRHESKVESQKFTACSDCYLSIDDIVDRADEIFKLHRKISRPHSTQTDSLIKSWQKIKAEDRVQYFLEPFSKINRKLRGSVSESDYPLVEIAPVGGYSEKRYGIALDKNRITIQS